MTAPSPFEPFPDDAVLASIGNRLERMAQRFGERPALSSPSTTLTYAELGRETGRRASGLRDLLGSEPLPVAVMAAHDGPLVVAVLSVIVAGHTLVVLDPGAPSAVTTHALREAGVALILHDAAHQAPVDVALQEIDAADRPPTALIDHLDGAPRPIPERGPTDPAMLAFTSGTSGQPKAAVITHGLIMNLVRGATNALHIGSDDRMPMLFPLSMAVAAYPMFLPLLNGGQLSTLDVRSQGFAPIGPFLADERITVAYLAPTVVRFLTDALDGLTFPDLRMVALGGEGIDFDAVELTQRLFGPYEIALGYGTTETGVVSLGVRGRGDVDDDLQNDVSCGVAVPEVELLVLGPDGRSLPRGEAGEIAVASPHVFAGYLGHADLDANCLGPDPSDRPGWRLYRTGDVGRLNGDGELVVLGRVDTKVKVRGRFVVIGHVEASLHRLDGINDAVVVPVRTDGITTLVAVVSGVGDPITWRALLLESHESHQVPGRWRVVEDLPRLPNGKVDRRAAHDLAETAIHPDPSGEARSVANAGAGDAANRTDRARIVRQLTEIWRSLLGRRDLSPDLDFFNAGGDSLLAAQMLIHVEQQLGVTIPMGRLVHVRTIDSLADVLVGSHPHGAQTGTTALVQEGSPTRPRLWFVHDLQGSAFRVRHLAAALGPDQPVWSFESPLLAGEPNRCSGLEDFVADYVTDLLIAQPSGPYWLAGYSFGGICAYEMARQLVHRGREVAFVGVVDVGPGYRGPGWHGDRSPFRPWFGVAQPPAPGTSIAGKARHYLAMAQDGPGRLARHLMVRSGVARVVDPWRFERDLAIHGRVRPTWRLWYAWEEHWKLAARAWDRTAAYPGPIDLFWANGTPATDDTLGWGERAREVRIHRFEGDHFGILEERGAPSLARALRSAIDMVAVAPVAPTDILDR